MKTALTIAGSDCSGGAGIQADLKTFTSLGIYGMSAITALTAQNTTGVFSVHDIPVKMVAEQLDAIFNDIKPDAVKIGMVYLPEIIEIIAEKLIEYKAKNIVLDPVMVSTSGCPLMAPEASETLQKKLFPLAKVITPNMAEASFLIGLPSGKSIENKEEMIMAAKKISTHYKGAILLKGGHLKDTSDDLLYVNDNVFWYEGQRIDTPNTHGTGCTLSSAIAAYLAIGNNLEDAISNAKKYLSGALSTGLDLGHGSGPLNHCWNI